MMNGSTFKAYQTRRSLFLGITVVIVFLVALQFLHSSPFKYSTVHPADATHETEHKISHKPPANFNPPGTSALESLLVELYNPLIHPITTPEFRAIDGEIYKFNKTPIWTAPLGRDLCIVDIDNRPFTNPDEFLHEGPIVPEKFHYYGAGVFNHYLYSLIHGYTYHFMRNDGYPNRAPNWAKPRGFLDIVNSGSCRFVLLVDADSAFTNLQLPFEWLMNRWGITEQHAITTVKDPETKEPNYDSKGRVNDNSGFVLAQNLPITVDILEAWIDCPDNEAKYPGCDKHRFKDFCEQGAWSEYTRYHFDDDILEVECNDVNGYPHSGRPCNGVFVRHFWDRKHELKNTAAEALYYNMMTMLKQQLIDTPGALLET